MSKEWPVDEDDFAAYYSFAPAALALRETIRLGAIRELDLAEPILDVGCGDGLFARLAYPERQVWGIDINPTEIKRAQGTSSYKTLICGNVCDVDLPAAFFGSAVANCSLEHVPDLVGALRNIRRALRPGARFALIVPTPNWTSHLAVPEMLRRVGLGGLARAYGDALDRVFHHVHLHDEAWWSARLREADFVPEETRLIVRRPASWAFDLLLPPSALGWLIKRVTGRWVVAPSLRPLSERLARRVIDLITDAVPNGSPGEAGEYLLLTRVP